MGFTVQRMATGDSADSGWAIVLDHEHIMFVGSYQQCENWLDQHDVANVHGQSREAGQTPSDKTTSWRQSLKTWFQKIAGNSTSSKVPKHVMDLLKNSNGHCGAVESVAMAVIVGMLYVSVWQTSSIMAWQHSVLYRDLARMPSATRSLFDKQKESCSSSCSNDSAEIACDLAPAGD